MCLLPLAVVVVAPGEGGAMATAGPMTRAGRWSVTSRDVRADDIPGVRRAPHSPSAREAAAAPPCDPPPPFVTTAKECADAADDDDDDDDGGGRGGR